jgi:hypothetical protein
MVTLFIPSTANTVLPTPIEGMFTVTPKWHASPKDLVWNIPFPSTSITSGVNSGLVARSLATSATNGGSSLNARNPGQYGTVILAYS